MSTTPSKGMSFREAAKKLRTEQITATASRSDDYGGFQIKTPTGDGFTHGGLGGVQFVEVSVDTEIGLVRVERVVAVHDCGRPINPLQIESQINGGIIQGTSWALYENRHLCRKTGAMVNAKPSPWPGLMERSAAGKKELCPSDRTAGASETIRSAS